MSEKSNIAWTDSTVNFWEGCTMWSPGCINCYAMTRDARMLAEKIIHWGKGAPRRKSKSAVKAALSMNRKPWICNLCGESFDAFDGGQHRHGSIIPTLHRRRIFSLSLGDWLDDEVPIEWMAEMLDTIRRCDQVTWILCSKRWENFNRRMVAVMTHHIVAPETSDRSDAWKWCLDWVANLNRNIPGNIIGLCSVEDQKRADERIPQFLTVPLACRGLSLEPLLGPVNLARWIPWHGKNDKGEVTGTGNLGWLIIGGESGPNARACEIDWIRSLVAQGKAAGVATFVKQLGAYSQDQSGTYVAEFSEEVAQSMRNAPMERLQLADKKGGDLAEWPTALRVQEWPKGF